MIEAAKAMGSAVPAREVRRRAGNNWNRGIASRRPGMNILKCARTFACHARSLLRAQMVEQLVWTIGDATDSR
jgi:hypothetical protein